jgi:hypothetical protein
MVPKLMPKNFQDWKYVVVNRSFLSKAFQGWFWVPNSRFRVIFFVPNAYRAQQ